MLNEIKRTTWARFLRRFSADNRYRFATVTVSHRGRASVVVNQGIPFMGMVLNRKGRLIDGINLYVGHWSPEQLHNPSVAISEPARLILDSNSEADKRLVVESEDGSRVEIKLDVTRVEPRLLVEKLAYTLSERQGFVPGTELENWLEAEQSVRQLETRFV